MKNVNVAKLYRDQEQYADQMINVRGWIRTLRASNVRAFIELNDGTCFQNLQIVVEKEKIKGFDFITKLHISSAIEVQGVLILTPEEKQPFELDASSITLSAHSDSDYPLQKKRHSLEYLREIAHLRSRSNTFSAVFRTRSILSYAIHRFFQGRGFVHVHTPIITASDCEGAGELFRVTTLDLNYLPLTKKHQVDYGKDFFGKETYLTVSGQLQAEAFAMAFQKVYTFGPTFRAENSNTTRHAAEFWMVEPEMAFADINDNMDLAEKMMKYLIGYLLEHCQPEMNFFNQFIDKELFGRLERILQSKFERISYTEAIAMLEKSDKQFVYPVQWGVDLQTEHERYLTEEVYQKPVFVTDYPKDIKAFYMRQNDDGKTVAAMDLLVPGVGEIIGGSQREERYSQLVAAMQDHGIAPESMQWYLDLRRYGGCKHAGFGLGFERMLMYVTGMKNIRDIIPFARTVNNAEF